MKAWNELKCRCFVASAAKVLAAWVLVAVAPLSAAQYSKFGVRLLSRVPLADIPGAPTAGSGGAGYVSPSGREYAVFGVRNGTAIIDITNPTSPVIVAHIPGPVSTWHEPTVLGDFAYSVADGVNQGMHIIDLRQADQGIVTLAATYTGNNLQRVHTIQANENKKLLYLNGSNLANGGLVVLDVSNPVSPVQVGAWSTRYVHDCQVVDFTSGPYAGREIAFLCCGGAGLYIVDITDKSAMVTLGSIDYIAGSNYCHSGQLSPDGRYFLVNDEFDEGNGLVPTCTTHIIDVSNLSNPTYVGAYTNGGNYIDHNSYMRDGLLFLAAYRGGLRIYDLGALPTITELGYFDTYPEGDGFSYTGAWGVSAKYPSGNVAIFDINRGLFVLDPSEAVGLGAPLTSAAVVVGTHVSGGISELRKSDEQRYVARFQATPQSDVVPEIRVQIEAETTISPASTMDLAVESRVLGPLTATGSVRLWNWSQGRFDAVGSFPVGPVDAIQTLPGLSAADYVDAGGRIRMRLSVLPGPEMDLAAYTYQVDMVKFTVRR